MLYLVIQMILKLIMINGIKDFKYKLIISIIISIIISFLFLFYFFLYFSFKEILSLPDNSINEKIRKYNLLNSLNCDFIISATSYAKTIISEYFLENDLKSIQLQHIGGHAGGKKFLWRGILFKLAYGEWGPYTGIF